MRISDSSSDVCSSDLAKALGYAAGQQDAWSKQVDEWGTVATTTAQQQVARAIPADVLELAAELERAPRHLGIHSGGLVICDRPIVEVCPVAWARMQGASRKAGAVPGSAQTRTDLQWNPDDCAGGG